MSERTNAKLISEIKVRLPAVIDACSKEELQTLLPIIESVLETIRAKDSIVIK